MAYDTARLVWAWLMKGAWIVIGLGSCGRGLWRGVALCNGCGLCGHCLCGRGLWRGRGLLDTVYMSG